MALSGRSCLSRHAQELVVRCKKFAKEPFHCDLLIVGSGYGGAVAAARAAGHKIDGSEHPRPARVWVVERGSEYLPGMFPSRFSEIAGHVRFDLQDGRARGVATGLFDARIGSDVSVFLGSGVGGGSLINAGVMVEPDPEVFASEWPADITHEALQDGFEKARKMLSPSEVPEERECDKLRSFREVSMPHVVEPAPVTVHWCDGINPVGVRMHKCTLCGDCMTGCNQSAKGSLDTNYLALARARDAELFAGVTVRTVARDKDDSFWEVRWQYTDPALRTTDGELFVVRAKRVVLAAGSLGSTEILLRSRTPTLRFWPRLGENFSANGGKIAAGARHSTRVHLVGDQESDPADDTTRLVGPTITGLLRVPSQTNGDGEIELGFVIEEFGVPAGLRNVFGETVALLMGLNVFDMEQMGGSDPFAVTDEDIEHISLYGMTGNDGAAGTLRLRQREDGGASEGLRIDWEGVAKLPLFARMQKWLKRHLKKVNAVLVPDLIEEINDRLPVITVHPLGGCRMANDFNSGAVDHCGRVFRDNAPPRDDLVILDGSIVPRAIGINPALTIAALAERAMPLLLEQWEWQRDDSRIGIAPQRPQGRRRELPARDVVWSIRERLQGRFSVDQQNFFWARMDIEFEDIPSFRRALTLHSRVVAVRRAVVELHPAKKDDDEFTVDEASNPPICRAELDGSVALFVPLPGAEPGGEDHRVTLDYRLSVQSVQGGAGTPLTVGGRLDGSKLFGRNPDPDAGEPISPWRQLTEMQMRYNGKDAGRWVLDMEDLAERRDPLLRMVRLSSMPDALDDLAAIALYVLRRTLVTLLVAIFKHSKRPAKACHLDLRWPGRLCGVEPDVTCLDAGARLTHYTPMNEGQDYALPPVLLIHGLGYSGASFTDASMPNSLAATLLRNGREVWILDLRSSIGNEYARHGDLFQDARRWTVEGVARADLPQAVAVISEAAGGNPIDVFAHCMGAMMFCLAALGGPEMKGKLRAVVLSQVGPLIRFSPMNRLRGYLASYLQQFLRIDTVDTTPNFASRIEEDGRITWVGPSDPSLIQVLTDALLAMFPYPDDDDEAARESGENLRGSDFRRIRHRGDAIFGQQFEIANVGDTVLARLEVFTGWVMVPMLAQAIHFARLNMLTNSRGHNAVLHEANFKERFSFPLLIIHGKRNRVFNWRGSHDSWKLLNRLRQGSECEPPPPQRLPNRQCTLYGAGTATQLAVFDNYGHMDCVIGQGAHRDIFAVVSDFFREADRHQEIGSETPPLQFEAPWIGPMIGWIRPAVDKSIHWWLVRLIVHPQLRRSETKEVVIVPMQAMAGIHRPMTEDALTVPWPPKADRHATLDLFFSTSYVKQTADTFLLLTMHQDLPLEDRERATSEREWLKDGHLMNEPDLKLLERWLNEPSNAPALEESLFSLAPKVVGAADRLEADPDARGIRFALASCQYPPGLFDERPAGASYKRLQADAMSHDGPQFLMLCGDQVYVDDLAGLFDPAAKASVEEGVFDSALDRTYELNWRLLPFRRTTARLPTYAMLDDHEVRDNWKGMQCEPSPPREPVVEALCAFNKYQYLLNPARPLGPGKDRSFFAYPGGMRLFVLDTRSQRQPRDALNVGKATIIAVETMSALQKALVEPPLDAVKLIVSPSPFLPAERFDPDHQAERLRSDSWSGYPASIDTLLRFISDQKIRRVVFLSGDAHLSCVCSFKFKSTDIRIVSVISSGMYAPWPFANQRPDELVLDGNVDLGLPKSPIEGSMQLHAISMNNGYAIVDIQQKENTARLSVSLRSSNGATTDCVVQLA